MAVDLPFLLAERDAENARLRAQVAVLQQEQVVLLQQLAALQAELGRMRGQLDEANAQLAALVEQIGQLTAAVAKGNDRIAELLAIAQRKKARPPANPKPPPPPPGLSEDERTAFETRPQPPAPPGPKVDQPRPPQRRPGRQPLPDHLELEQTIEEPDACCCGCKDYDWVDEVVEPKLHVSAHQRRRVTRRKTGRCRACGRRNTAEAPPAPFERSKVTCEWLAWLCVQKFQLLSPLDRIRRYLGAQGVPLSISFLVSQVEAACDLVAAIDGYHWKLLLAGSWMGSDGTGFKVQVKDVGLHHGFLEVYHRDEIVVFQYEPEKGGQTQASKLKSFKGTLVVDAESRYNESIRSNPDIKEANCNAHPRRKLEDAEKVQPVLAEEGGRFVSAMFAEEAAARERNLSEDALLQWRQERIRPLTEEFRQWMDAVAPTLIPSDPLRKVIQYYDNHWTELMRFLTDPKIPMDNSASEREFQSVAKLRQACLFAGGTEGAHRAAILLGLAATCRRQGVDFGAYLTWVFIRRGTHRHKYDLPVEELTPAAYKRSLGPG